MAHYAFLNSNNIVTEVIVGKDETELIEGLTPEQWYGNFRGQKCVQTSYNTIGGVHTKGGTPLNKNYAGIGYTWDGIGFAAPQPYPSWKLNANSYLWESPIPYPVDNNQYQWVESTLSWEIFEPLRSQVGG
jgi:hypothetical protein